jgi:hypothetical protein
VFYEIGLMQALGKDTLMVIREPRATLPSDLVRTEYVLYDGRFDDRIRAFLRRLPVKRRVFRHCRRADGTQSTCLAIDYYRRAFLLTGDEEYCMRTDELLKSGEIGTESQEQC